MPVNKRGKKKKEDKPEGTTISIPKLCTELGVDPKKGRARMRKSGRSAEGKRYADVIVGSKEHEELSVIIAG